jgi:hypothetical protein
MLLAKALRTLNLGFVELVKQVFMEISYVDCWTHWFPSIYMWGLLHLTESKQIL